MTLAAYIKDKIIALTLSGLCIFLLSVYLLALGNSPATVLLIALTGFLVVLARRIIEYRSRKRYFDRIDDWMERLEPPYLIAEFLGDSPRLEDQLYQEILRRVSKAAMEQTEELVEAQGEYREFIEGWIHEVKLPITGMRLAYHNEKNGGQTLAMEAWFTALDNAVERVLFHTRAECLYKDFQVAETDLEQIASRVLRRNKYILLQSGMSARVECGGAKVVTDRKWVEFILTQIVGNAVKYKKENGGEIVFSSREAEDAVRLSVRDAGIGIPPDELGRVFGKGFTGSNGRSREKSTGIGLYLCAKLCRKLEIGIEADSMENEYTEITLSFPKNHYLSKLSSS